MIKIENTDKEFLNMDSGWRISSNYSYCTDATSFIRLDFKGNIDVYFQANSDCGYVNIYFDDEETPTVVNAGGNGSSKLIYSKTFDDKYVHRIRIRNSSSKVTAFDYFVVSGEPVVYGSYDTQVKFVGKYLVRFDSVLYTIIDDVLTALDSYEPTADLFRNHGLDEVPNWSIISHFVNPEVLLWNDSEDQAPNLTAIMTATTPTQTFESPDYYMADSTVLGIEKAIAVATESVQFAVSFDSGATWKTFIDGVWAELSENSSGMSATTLNSIPTENWNVMVADGKFRFRISLMDETSEFTSLIVDYLNEAEVPAESNEGDE